MKQNMRENYIIIKQLPDGSVGTEVLWDEEKNTYYYKKSAWVSPHELTYLTAGQVTQTPEFFCKANEYPEYYAYHYPVYSRSDILALVKKYFPDRRLGGVNFSVSASHEFNIFDANLRELGKTNAETILNRNKLNNK